MGQNLNLKDLDTTYDSDSTASNSIIDGYVCNKIDNNNHKSNINTVAFKNSSNIQIGDRVVYNGPVTINQDVSNVETDARNVDSKIVNKRRKWKFIVFGALIAALFLIIVVLSILFGTENVLFTTKKPNDFKIVSRDEWGAKLPEYNLVNLTLPLGQVIISHTVMKNCYTKDCCVRNLREIQDIHFGFNFGDIGYNFVICNDGNAYEGAGWKFRGAHTLGQNSKSYGISFNGNFKFEVPNKNQVNALFSLLELGRELGYLKEDYRIYGARQFSETESPGDALYQMIQTWDHWSEET